FSFDAWCAFDGGFRTTKLARFLLHFPRVLFVCFVCLFLMRGAGGVDRCQPVTAFLLERPQQVHGRHSSGMVSRGI
ncbi:unnamed protein product, partial [Ectocarpus sp. 12 AP-2014]